MGAIIEIKYFNSIILKKTVDAEDEKPMYGGSRGIPQALGGYPVSGLLSEPNDIDWFLEESRIQGGFNEVSLDYGVKAYVVDDQNLASIRESSMIYSGLYNSRTSTNQTNQFSVGEDISKSVDPANGSIQKLHAEDTNLIIFQENKVSRALIDKDAIYSAEGGGTITSAKVVLGEIIPYAGTYGISKDPRSFATHGFRKYFTDRYRNAVLRLSQDGITEVSEYGMYNFFRDSFSNITSDASGQGKILGMWDSHNKQYVVSLQSSNTAPSSFYATVSYDDSLNGFTSFYSYKPEDMFSVRSNVYSMKNGSIYKHYSENAPVGQFYGQNNKSSITFVLNDNVYVSKNFKTINYEGDNGWQVDSFVSDPQGKDPDFYGSFLFNYNYDTTAFIPSYLSGAYDTLGNVYPNALTTPIYRSGFDRKENKYYAVINNNSNAKDGEVLFGQQMSGIKGRFATVTMSTDNVTQPGGIKELFSVGSEYSLSSY